MPCKTCLQAASCSGDGERNTEQGCKKTVFFRTPFCDQCKRGPSAIARYGPTARHMSGRPLVPARVGEDLMQVRHGSLTQLFFFSHALL